MESEGNEQNVLETVDETIFQRQYFFRDILEGSMDGILRGRGRPMKRKDCLT